MIRSVVIFIVCVISIVTLWYFFSEVLFAVLICLLPLFILIVIHGERIDIFSGRRLGILVAVKGNSLALTGAFFVPGRVTEILKPLYFKKKKSLPMADGVSILLAERFYDLVMVLCMGVGALYFLPVSESGLVGVSKLVAIVGVTLLLLSLIIINMYPNICVRIINLVPFIKVRNFLAATFKALKDSLSHGLKLWQLILTVVVWLGSWALYWFYLQWDGGVSLTVYQALVVFLVGTFGLTITVTPGGLGTFEAVVALLLQHYGYPMEVAFASAVGLRLVAFVPNAIVTLYVTLVEGFDFMRARQSNELSGNL